MDPYEIETYRLFSDVLLQHACGLHGRGENDPFYQIVTEGRDSGMFQKTYSSCGDLAHWLHFRLGVRTSWVNRREHKGWTSGLNVSKLAFSSVALVMTPETRHNFESGDVGVIWSNKGGTDAHVFVVREPGWSGQASAPTLHTAEYGQPGGALKTRQYVAGKIGTRILQRVLPLPDVLQTAKASGLLVKPDKRAILDACEYLKDSVSGEILDQCESAVARF
jgi:hypothetical protein